MIKAGIVGAGQGGTSILKTLIGVANVEVIGIADLDGGAPGMVLAREQGIFATTDFMELLNIPDKKVIIEATGAEKVRTRLYELADSNTEIVNSSGALLMMLMVESREKLIDELGTQANEMAGLGKELSQTILDVSAASSADVENLYNSVLALIEVTQNNSNQLEETHEIINFIKRVANQTKLLGLNASIEAARAGNEGLGFNVVAQQIRKMAEDSAQSTQKINGIIEQIRVSTQETKNLVDQIKENTGRFVNHQENYTKLLQKVNGQIESLAQNLNNLSRN